MQCWAHTLQPLRFTALWSSANSYESFDLGLEIVNIFKLQIPENWFSCMCILVLYITNIYILGLLMNNWSSEVILHKFTINTCWKSEYWDGWVAGWMDGFTSLRLHIENLVLIGSIIESCGYSFLSLKVTHSFLKFPVKLF